MAGLSRRFAEAGYAVPKYMLAARGRSVFAHAVASFAAYFETEPFLFILRDIDGTAEFVRGECEALGIAQPILAVLDAPTAGQAETVAKGLAAARVPADTPITIFNIDTFRPGFRHPATFAREAVDGYLEVFEGSGANWSYVRPVPGTDRAAETAEKRAISTLCCTGLYHFRSAGLFRTALAQYIAAGPDLPELYIAPIYNTLIAAGRDIRFAVIPPQDVVFCGVPAEYEAFRDGS